MQDAEEAGGLAAERAGATEAAAARATGERRGSPPQRRVSNHAGRQGRKPCRPNN